MTKQKLTELFDQGYEIKSKLSTQLAIELQKELNPRQAKINADIELTPEGQKRKVTELKKQLARELFGIVSEQKSKYVAIAKEATALAYKVKTDAIKKPSDAVQIKLFEQELASLQTSVMLSARSESATQAIAAFSSKWSDTDVYYADQLKQSFPTLISAVTAIDGSTKPRMELGRVYDRLVETTNTEDIQAADKVLGYFADGENVQLFRDFDNGTKTIKTIIGSVANHINDPETAIGILDGTVETFGGLPGTHVIATTQQEGN